MPEPNHICAYCHAPFYNPRKKVTPCKLQACKQKHYNHMQTLRRQRIAQERRKPDDSLEQKLEQYFEKNGWEDRYTGRTPSAESSMLRSTLVDIGHTTAVPLTREWTTLV